MAAIPYQDDFPSLKDYFGGNGGNFAKFGESWNDAVSDADFWEDSSAESRENLMNFFLADYNNRFNAYQNELAYKRQQEMIAAENEYNSPKNQMARYMEGGLNPNVIYGQIQPGQQSQIAQYDPVRATEVRAKGDPRGTKEQKLEQAMTVLGMVGSMVKQITGMAQDVEGVKSASLQNELLAAKLPFEKRLAEDRYNWYAFPTFDEEGNYVRPMWFDLLYPGVTASELAGYRADFQDYYNKNLLPKLNQIQGANVTKANAMAGQAEYNEQMLESLPPAVRPWASLFFQLVRAFTGAYGVMK